MSILFVSSVIPSMHKVICVYSGRYEGEKGADNSEERISEHILCQMGGGGIMFCFPSNISRNTRSFENLGIGNIAKFPDFSWDIFSHVARLDQLHAREDI